MPSSSQHGIFSILQLCLRSNGNGTDACASETGVQTVQASQGLQTAVFGLSHHDCGLMIPDAGYSSVGGMRRAGCISRE